MVENGAIANGNGRVAAIKMAYSGGNKAIWNSGVSQQALNNSAKDYRDYLVDHAEDFGLDPKDVAKIKNPILVRKVPKNIDLSDIIESKAGGEDLGPAELATSDAKKISTASLAFLDKENGDLESPANKGFVKKALYEIAGEGELNGVTDKSGNPATNGYTRVKNAMFAKAYQDENLLQQFTESNEMPIKNVFTAMQNAAPFIVR
ncbi:MAG: hypothetical protein KHX20_04640 [Megasphaera sp.]|jgi:hypothetical protein|nr:hypothetical protein [Megasphaera sp.]